jgi:hypothetical protein
VFSPDFKRTAGGCLARKMESIRTGKACTLFRHQGVESDIALESPILLTKKGTRDDHYGHDLIGGTEPAHDYDYGEGECWLR